MKLAVLADTHIPRRARDLPAAAYDVIRNCDAIVHAGDVIEESFLKKLAALKDLYAVAGNNDRSLVLPDRLELTLSGVNLAVVHDSGQKKGRAERMRRWFPEAQVVIFGHSHIPINEVSNGLLLLSYSQKLWTD